MMNDIKPFSPFETQLMHQLIKLATPFVGATKPNPVVAAAVYKDRAILSKGVHQKAGDDHAEVIALSTVDDPSGAAIMITLEPCTHFGKTPPCVEAIINAGIKDVIFASYDPNPVVKNMNAKKILEDAGIRVRVGLCKEEVEALNPYYYHYHREKRPFVILKAATSLDGKVALASGESKYITSEDSLKKVHHYRSKVDAIVIGQKTVLMDNASLSVRYDQLPSTINAPSKIILSTEPTISKDHPIFNTNQNAEIILASQKNIGHHDSEIIYWDLAKGAGFDWDKILTESYKKGFQSIMIEGGTTLFSSAIEAGIVDQLLLFMAPKLMGEEDAKSVFEFSSISSLKEVYNLKNLSIDKLGSDIMISGFF